MVNIGTITKDPAEVIPFAADFDAVVTPNGEAITSQTVTVLDSAGVDVTSALLVTSQYAGTVVSGVIQAGTADNDYRIQVAALTTTYTFEAEITLQVRD